MEKCTFYIVSVLFIFGISQVFSNAVKKQNFDFGDEAMDPGVIDYVCNNFCSNDNSEEDGANFAQILQEVQIIKKQMNSLIEAVSGNAGPGASEVVPVEYKKAYPVSLAKSDRGDYRLTLDQARSLCREQDSTLATRAQLEAAFQQGMDYCSCGWLEDGYAAFPLQYPREGCFPEQNANGPGVRTGCTWQSTWNAWCFNKDEANRVNKN